MGAILAQLEEGRLGSRLTLSIIVAGSGVIAVDSLLLVAVPLENRTLAIGPGCLTNEDKSVPWWHWHIV